MTTVTNTAAISTSIKKPKKGSHNRDSHSISYVLPPDRMTDRLVLKKSGVTQGCNAAKRIKTHRIRR